MTGFRRGPKAGEVWRNVRASDPTELYLCTAQPRVEGEQRFFSLEDGVIWSDDSLRGISFPDCWEFVADSVKEAVEGGKK